MLKQRFELLTNLKNIWDKLKIPNISKENWKFLNFLIRQWWYKSGLEIWTANWYSTIWLGDAFKNNNWKLVSYEISLKDFEMANLNIKKAKLSNIISLRNENFLLSINKDIYDFVFIDWRKSEYLDYFIKIKPYLTKRFLIIFDDVIKFKHKMENLYSYLEKQKKLKYFVLKIDQDDWVMILYN